MSIRRDVGHFFQVGPPARWTVLTIAGLVSLIVFWGWQLFATWQVWGNLSIDSGREMYVPALLTENKTLYRDTWYVYTPASAYFNSYLFRLFGIHLNVLYWAGSLSVLVAAIFFYLIGMRLSAPLVGWAAAAAQIGESFHANLFCFPLPYSFAAVYGCVVGAALLWVLLVAARSSSSFWMFVAGSLAAIELLLKPEFAVAAYGTLILVFAVRVLHEPVAITIARNLLTILPGLVFSALVLTWMVSLGGFDFITNQNIMSWPTSYFMKTFGHAWLEGIGFDISAAACGLAALRTLFLGGILLELYTLFGWTGRGRVLWLVVLPIPLVAYVLAVGFDLPDLLRAVLLPDHMVLYVLFAAILAWWNFAQQRAEERDPRLPVLLSFAGLFAFRSLMKMDLGGYAIFFNGPVILAYLLIGQRLLPSSPLATSVRLKAMFVCSVPALVAAYAVTHYVPRSDVVPLTTPRGTIRVSENMARNYRSAIAFMKEKAEAGESVLSVPEDTSLYFLSETYCPTRLYAFTPGVIAPGYMTDEAIGQMEQKRVRYLLWSNRSFPEYGVPAFGTDFGQEFGEYLRTRYRRVEQLTRFPGWQADIWERRPDMPFR